jgi:hypothetical protein
MSFENIVRGQILHVLAPKDFFVLFYLKQHLSKGQGRKSQLGDGKNLGKVL